LRKNNAAGFFILIWQTHRFGADVPQLDTIEDLQSQDLIVAGKEPAAMAGPFDKLPLVHLPPDNSMH